MKYTELLETFREQVKEHNINVGVKEEEPTAEEESDSGYILKDKAESTPSTQQPDAASNKKE